jgi:hypothetical protein
MKCKLKALFETAPTIPVVVAAEEWNAAVKEVGVNGHRRDAGRPLIRHRTYGSVWEEVDMEFHFSGRSRSKVDSLGFKKGAKRSIC